VAAVAVAVLVGGACAGGGDQATATTTAVPSFSCLAAQTALGLTQGSRADDAERRLKAVIASDAYTPAEHAFFRALLRRLRRLELAGSDHLGDRLDGVHCDLSDGDTGGGPTTTG
jgi:hypothetical protein